MKDFSPSPLTTAETMLSCFIRIKSLHEDDTITNSGEIRSCQNSTTLFFFLQPIEVQHKDENFTVFGSIPNPEYLSHRIRWV